MILTLEEFNKIVDHISSMIEQNCSEEELDEISTSIGAGAYSTPNAFSSDKDSNGSEKLNLDPQFTFSQKPNDSKKNTVNMKEGIQVPIKPGLRLIHTLTQSELEVVSVSGNTVTMKRISVGDPKYKNIVGEKTKTSIPLLQKTDNYKVKTNESIAFHDKHPDLAKKYGIVGPFADSKKAIEMGKSQKKSVYTHDGKRHYLVDPKLEKDLEKAGFKKIEESAVSSGTWKTPTIDDLYNDRIVKIKTGKYSGRTGKIHDMESGDKEGDQVDIFVMVDLPTKPFTYLTMDDILVNSQHG